MEQKKWRVYNEERNEEEVNLMNDHLVQLRWPELYIVMCQCHSVFHDIIQLSPHRVSLLDIYLFLIKCRPTSNVGRVDRSSKMEKN